MKKRHFRVIILIGLILGSMMLEYSAWAKKFVKGQLVLIIKNSQVRVKPGMRAKVIADIDEGSMLMVLEQSKSKKWIYLEDEDGVKGWVPTKNTDFSKISDGRKGHVMNPKDAQKTRIVPPPTMDQLRLKHDGKKDILAGLTFRTAFTDPNADRAVGLNIAYMPSDYSKKLGRYYRTGLLSGFSLAQKRNFSFSRFQVPIRLALLAYDAQGRVVSGPDMGALWMGLSNGIHKVSMSLGYSLGMRGGSSLFFLLRPGIDFFHETRLSVEFSVLGVVY